jgi:enterochelin esterase-like enzyme
VRKAIFWGLMFWLTACGVSNPLALPTDTPLPPTSTPAPTATSTPAPDSILGFNEFLAQAGNLRPQQRQDLANRYTAQLAETPITEGNQAVFLWLGAADSVAVIGDMNDWNVTDASQLTRLEGTDLWYLVAEFEPDARLDYQFLVDGQEQRLDPLNPKTIRSLTKPNSVLAMPAYETPPELQPSETTIPQGTITSHTIDSSYLNQTRTFFVYEPAGQIVGSRLPTVYFNNGTQYLNLIDTPAILDSLIAKRIVPPLIAVFVPPIDIAQEYMLEDAYVAFLADELVPYVQRTYDADPNPDKTGVIGSSSGGLAAIYTALSRPDVFGLAAGQSGTYGVHEDELIRQVKRRAGTANAQPVRYYLVAGSYEAAGGDEETGNILAANQRLAEALNSTDQDFLYEERPEGHSLGLWEGTIGRALAFLYGPSS